MAGNDQKITIDYDAENAQVILDGSASYDLDGSIAGYQWTKSGVALGDLVITTTTLDIGTHGILLTVTDDEDSTASDIVQITVEKEKLAPIANAGQDQKHTIAYDSENASVTLDGSASSDMDGNIDSYLWTEGGTVLGDIAVLTTSLGIGTHHIVLTVTDNDGLMSSDTLGVAVEKENNTPIADAGIDQKHTIKFGDETIGVLLNGSRSSDLDGYISSYRWTQDGTVLGNYAFVNTSLGAGTHQILLTVADNDGLESSDVVQVTIENEKLAPVAKAGTDRKIKINYDSEIATVTLDGSSSYDLDGKIASYRWTKGGINLGNTAVITTTLGVDTHHIVLTVTDNDNLKSSDTIQVIVEKEMPPPVANAGQDQKFTLEQDADNIEITMNGSGSYDPDGDIVSYRWTGGGVVLGSTEVATASLGVGTYNIELTVTDNDNLKSSDTVQITIEKDKAPPVANAGENQNITIAHDIENSKVTLDGSGSTDIDGTIVSYQWTQGLNILGNTAVLTASLDVGTYDMLLTVTDSDGLKSFDSVQVTIEKDKAPPVADAGQDQKHTTEYNSENASVTLDGSGSYDPDGDITSYQWTEGGTVLGSSEVMTVSLAVGTHDILLTVSDNDDLSAGDIVQITVEAGKEPPVADAGQDQKLTIDYDADSTQATVTLNGSASYDPDGDITGYKWTEGQSILGDSALTTASLGIGTHHIVLTVTDDAGLESSDTIKVTVEKTKVPPIANAGQDQKHTIAHDSENATVTLDGSNSYDLDGDIARYQWTESGTVLGDSAVITALLGVGTHDILLTVTDNNSLTASDIVQIIIEKEKTAPIANAGQDQKHTIAYDSENASVTLDGSSSYDFDGDITGYQWTEGGTVLGSSAVITALLGVGTHDILLTVTDDEDLTASDIVQITIEKEKITPVADAGKNQNITIDYDIENSGVTLDGSGSTDTDGSITSYRWTKGDMVLGDSAVITTLLAVGTHDIVLTVADNDKLTACDLVQITVEKEKMMPVANAGQDQKITVKYNAENAAVTLDGSGSIDLDGNITSYQWTEGGIVLGKLADITASLGVGTHNIVLTVTDNDGLKSSDIVGVVIEKEKVSPIADAGQDQKHTIAHNSENASVTLDGSASSDLDGSILSYIWKAGEITLGNKAVISTALAVGTHEISLTVTDNDGLSSTDTMQVVVTQEASVDTGTYVQNIKMTATKKGKKWTITAEVTILDDSDNPVKDAEVFGTWSGSVNRDVSAVTYSKGKKKISKAKFRLSGIRQGGTFTFTVNDVTKSGMIYEDALNVETLDTIVIP